MGLERSDQDACQGPLTPGSLRSGETPVSHWLARSCGLQGAVCDTAISSRGRSSLHLTPICLVAVPSSLWLRGRGGRRAEAVRENPLLTFLPLSSRVPLLPTGTRVWLENQS